MQYEYFKSVWQSLNEEIQEKVLNIFAGVKSTIPYENIKTFDSLDFFPENRQSFAHSEFYRKLKQDIVSDEEYEHSKFRYTILKMRNLNNMNDI